MKLKEILDDLKKNDFFVKFLKENPDAVLYAGFFIFSDEGDKTQIDFFIPSLNRIAIFEYPFSRIRISEEEENLKASGIKKLNENLKVDIGDLRGKVEELKKENKFNQKTGRIIAILRDNLWNLTCLDDFLGILRIEINSLTGKCEKFEKGSLMDFMSVKKG